MEQDTFCPSVVFLRAAVWMMDHLNRCGDNGHIPEYLFQPFYPFGIHGYHIHPVFFCTGRLAGKDRDDFPPIGRTAIDTDLIIAPILQLLQPGGIILIDLRNSLCQCDGPWVVVFTCKKDTKG